ncbi:SpoIIE family protein phosphatase [Streptomyces nigra]|uniref:SpoIIE family protein phosphatase n=1 Tax=Streptomyces nigra TaxID=1827580 RepID=UPI00367F52D3
MLCGLLTWVNRGHHLPMLIRDNRRTTHLSCPWAGPMGADLGLPVATATEQLEPGDRLLLYTDGIVEARAGDGSSAGTGSSTSSAATTPADTPCTRHLPADDRGSCSTTTATSTTTPRSCSPNGAVATRGSCPPVNHPEAATGGATRGNQRPALRGSAPLSSGLPRVGGIASECGRRRSAGVRPPGGPPGSGSPVR